MKNLMGALLKAQAEFGTVRKDGRNPAFHSSYATLGSVQDAAMPALIANGIVCYQDARTLIEENGRITVFVGTMLYHVESGEQINQELGLVPAKQDPQGIGSAITYGRRYGLMTALGLSPDDDDGNAGQPAQPAKVRPVIALTAGKAVNPQAKQPEPLPEMPDDKLRKQFFASIGELYPKKEVQEEKRHAFVKWVTNGRTASSKELTADEMMTIIEKVNDKLREAAAAQAALLEVTPAYT